MPDYRLLQQRLQYEFQQPALLELALTHRSAGKRNNERLEFLGDAILNCTIAQELYHRFPRSSEGQLSRMRASLVKGETLAEVAREFELGQWLRLGPGELKSGGHQRSSILADTVEAVIGAISEDGDMACAQRCIGLWWEGRLASAAPGTVLKDAKTRLQEVLQAQGQPLPIYRVDAIAGDAHDQEFTVSCCVEGLAGSVVASDTNRRGAEQRAAEQVLTLLEQTVDDA